MNLMRFTIVDRAGAVSFVEERGSFTPEALTPLSALTGVETLTVERTDGSLLKIK